MADENPILNNPYEEPTRHYSTDLSGELDYAEIVQGRRMFTGHVQSIPVRQKQRELISAQDMEGTYGPLLVNRVRREVGRWRAEQYPQTTRITRELLNHWFLGERDSQLFFAQREAIETAIWLNEVAEKSNAGNFILRELEQARSIQENLPRVAFKMATGTGKTVVMAALIAYHFFNRQEYGNDTRFADNFLVIAPGITIRDRLAVLRVDIRDGIEAEDYYSQRSLVPRIWRQRLHQLNSKIVITNYHAFEPKTLQGNKRSPFDGKVGPDGVKREAREDWDQSLERLMSNFRPGSRLLVLNDEAHHCYLPKEDKRKAEGEDTKEENKRAAVWFTGLRQITRRFKVRSIYDLSATPYFLTGSGYEPYSLFPWVVSDFGLTEAIEAGLVKIPFLPTWDDTQQLKMPVLRNLYDNVKEGLPKAGVRKQRSRAKAKGETLQEQPPVLPDTLKIALRKFYENYREDFESRTHLLPGGDRQLELSDSPPVFVVVCNNTAVSKEVYKYIAGYEVSSSNGNGNGSADVRLGQFDLFSNYDPLTQKPRSRPPTLLIDSDAIENSGQIDAAFKNVFATELEQFKGDYARVHGAGSAEQITDAEILREVVNTVGRRGALGHHIRCVVSVSMLTEGWDANTVTHVVGLRAFGSQLLCEQVAGRALRRVSYTVLLPYDATSGDELPLNTQRKKGVVWKFPPEYAHIIGIPFQLYKGGKTTISKVPLHRIFAMPERESLEISFPVVEGYRIEYPEETLTWDFSEIGPYTFDASKIPLHTKLGTAISSEEKELTAEEVLAMRDQQIIYDITRALLRDHFSAEVTNPEFQKFHQLRAIVSDWYANNIRVLGRGPEWKKLVWFTDRKALLAHITRGILAGTDQTQRILPILNYYNPTSSSRFVRGQTSREIYSTQFSHVNSVVLDSGWEGRAAKVLDDLAAEKVQTHRGSGIEAWVKNSFLDFRVPYTDKAGKERNYLPDFLVRARDSMGDVLMLIIEVTGARMDKPEKIWTLRERWIPAVHSVRERYGWPPWDVLELDGEEAVADLRNLLREKLKQPGFGLWKDRGIDARQYVDAIRSEWDRE